MRLIVILLLLLPVKLLAQQHIEIDSSQVYTFVEQMPTMQNGEDISGKIRELILKKFRYPDSLQCGIISNLVFEFTISYTGKVVDPNISFPIKHDGCEEDYKKLKEIGISIINKFPDFKPGIKDGKYVSVKFKYPLHIDIQ